MSMLLLFLKAARLVDFGNYDLALGMILVDLDAIVLLRLWWTLKYSKKG
jgi:hypothetical protein